jgi:hypothetical protein
MLSVWSNSYVTYKSCNPFQAFKKETQNSTKILPITYGQTKVISTSKMTEKFTNTNVLQSTKRKLDEKNIDEDESLKRQKISDNKLSGIDDILNIYETSARVRTDLGSLPTSSSSSSSSSEQSQETDFTTSCYFSSSAKTKSSFKSPILNKVNKRSFYSY